MNKQRRSVLRKAISQLANANTLAVKDKTISHLKVVQQAVQECADDEEFAYDNLPESLQYSERGEDMSENVSILNDASADLEAIIEQIKLSEVYSYDLIKDDMVRITNLIQDTIDK